MAGIVHLCIVIVLFLVGGIAALMPYALSLFSKDVGPYQFHPVNAANYERGR
jgi:hypothetical protein